MASLTLPKISIITVCYNAEHTVERTLKSVVSQTYPNFEYVVLDGMSQDRTMQIARRYQNKMAQLVSEPDKGLYDAMNKALQLVGGDYIWYVNAGDEIYDEKTVELAMNEHNNEDFIYGKTLKVGLDGSTRSWHRNHPQANTLTWRCFLKGMVISHQAMIVRRSIAGFFDVRFSVTADLDWAIRVLKKATTVRDTNTYLCRYLLGGISTKKRTKSYKERFWILNKHFGLTKTLSAHGRIVFQALKRGSLS